MKPGRRTAARQLLLGFGWSGLAAAAAADKPAPVEPPPPQPPVTLNPIDEGLTQLLRVRRLHVQELSGGEAANQIRDMIIAAMQATGFFVVTENPDRADAVLKGTAEDLVFNEQFSSHESLGIRSNVSSGRGAVSGRTSERASAGIGITQSEDTKINDRKHEAVAAVRIVNKDGDVLWSTTQESYGAKFRGASADVADKITRQLRADLDRARKLPPQVATGRD
jgi:hypothetical protein